MNGTTIIMHEHYGTYIWFNYDENGLVTGFNYEGGQYYYIKNAQNDIIGIISSSGTVIANYTYDAWGNHIAITDGNGNILSSDAVHIANINPLRYRGYYFDSETGLYYLNSRYYDAKVGRFLNADGYVSTGQGSIGNNMFAYCLNNPVILLDNSGTRPVVGTNIQNETDEERTLSFAYMRALHGHSEIIATSPTNISSKGVEFIAEYERFYSTPYDDGYGNMTIGYGHVIQKGESFTSITKEEALAILTEDLKDAENLVNVYSQQYGIVWDQNQYDALVSFAFNAGNSVKKLIGRLNDGQDPRTVFGLYVYASNKKSLGLYRRRMDEADIYIHGTYERTYREWNE